jgi:hypothetical protein
VKFNTKIGGNKLQDFPNHTALQWVGVHRGDLTLFRPMVQKILNLEQFCQQKINKSKTFFFGEIGLLLVPLESPY